MVAIVTIGPKGSKLDWDNWGKPITDAVNSLWLLANPPVFKCYQITSGQNIVNSTWVPLTFNAEDYDTDNGHDNTTNNSRYTVVTAGLWEFTGKIAWDGNVTGRRQSRWYKNGSTDVIGSESSQAPASTISALPAMTVQVRMSVGDYIELHAAQDSGTTRTTNVANVAITSYMAGRLIAL